MIINVPMIQRVEFFYPPPKGHLGVFDSEEPFKINERFTFRTNGELLLEAVCVAIEAPGHSIRKDVVGDSKFLQKTKIHWVPLVVSDLAGFVNRVCEPFAVCPKCFRHYKTIVTNTKIENGQITRHRTCPNCQMQFKTIELIVEQIPPRRKRK